MKYCKLCNNAIADEIYNKALFDLPCPRCRYAMLSDYYDVGSKSHKLLLENQWIQMSCALPIPLLPDNMS